MSADMLTAALAAHDAGLCVIRANIDGSKRPVAVAGYGEVDAATADKFPG